MPALLLSALILASCGAPAVRSLSAPTAGAAIAAPGVSPSAAATFSVPGAFAVACGTMSDGVQISRGNATFLLNSPGRAAIKIASSGPGPIDALVPPGGAQSKYSCLLLDAGGPLPTFAGLIGPGYDGYVVEGTVPATSARPAPIGFVLPQVCAYVVPPEVGTDQTSWRIECGPEGYRDARGTLAPSLTAQGWTLCGAVTATASWAKGTARLGIAEGAGGPAGWPKISQLSRLSASTSCP